MSGNPLHKLMNPASIAIAGAGNNVLKMGASHALNMIRNGYQGTVYPIHPREEQVLGLKAYACVDDLPVIPDLGFLVVPSDQVPQLLEDFGKKGTRNIIIVSAGFAEMNLDGRRRQERLLDIAKKYGIRFLGPNCIGIINSAISLNTTIQPYNCGKGALGFASQSGTYVTQTLTYLERHGIRFSKAISVGNGASINLVDALEYLGEDDQTKAISLYIEGISDIPRFIEVARRITPNKPVLAQYSGGSTAGARSTQSHTGSMAAPEYLYRGLFRQTGIIQVNSIEELYHYGHAMAVSPRIKGRRVAVITNSGGPGAAMANILEKGGMEVPEFSKELQEKIHPLLGSHAPCRNPVDMTFSLDIEALGKTIPRLIFESGEVDGIILHGVFRSAFLKARYPHIKDALGDMSLEGFLSLLPDFIPDFVSIPSEFGKPLMISSFYGRDDDYASAYQDHNIPTFEIPEKAAGAMVILNRYLEITRRKNFQTPVPPPPVPEAEQMINKALGGSRQNFDEWESKRFLYCYGIPVSVDILASSENDAVMAADKLGYPLAMKACAYDILHKTGKGLIFLDLKTRDDVVHSYRSIQNSSEKPVAVIVSQMVRGEREFVAGIVRKEGFGPSVMFGLGGIFTEALGDTVFRPAPLTMTDAEEMINEMVSRKLLGQFRNMPAVNMVSLAALVHRLSLIPLIHPEIIEIDINPVIIQGFEPVAVDALIILKSM